MKKVLLSKGIFEITNSLYENIKKNNPELLESAWDFSGSDDSGYNIYVINDLVDEIFKNDKNKNQGKINKIRKEVEKIYKTAERNNYNVLDAFDAARDYLDKIKKQHEDYMSLKNNDEQKNNVERTQNQDNSNKQNQENGDKLNNVNKTFETAVRNKINEIINNPNMPNEYINECIKRYKKDLLEKYPNGFFKKDKNNIIKDMLAIIDKIRLDCKELTRYIKLFNDSSNSGPSSPATDSETVMFNNNEQEQQEIDNDTESPSGPNSESSSEYEVVPQRERELVYAESFKMSLKKLLKEDDEEFNLNDLSNENNNEIKNLDQLFSIFSRYGIEEVKKILDNNYKDDVDNLLNNYKNTNDNKNIEDEFKNIIYNIIKQHIPMEYEEYINIAVNRYMKEFPSKNYDNYANNETTIKIQKEEIKELYEKVIKDCQKFDKILDKLNHQSNNTSNG